MSGDIARTLRDTVSRRRSFLVTAIPRLAGKSTLLHAMLAELPRGAPVRAIGIDGSDIGALLEASRGGYFVIPEIAEGPWAPGYIRGAPVRRIFRGVGDGVALATALHAPDPESAFAILAGPNRVPDEDAQKIALVAYLRSLGDWRAPERRVVATVHAIEGVEDGRPKARVLHRWNERTDRFENA